MGKEVEAHRQVGGQHVVGQHVCGQKESALISHISAIITHTQKPCPVILTLIHDPEVDARHEQGEVESHVAQNPGQFVDPAELQLFVVWKKCRAAYVQVPKKSENKKNLQRSPSWYSSHVHLVKTRLVSSR